MLYYGLDRRSPCRARATWSTAAPDSENDRWLRRIDALTMSNSTEAPTQSPPRAVAVSVALLVILLVAGAFRFYNVNWDEGTYHIHPDKRHTTMVVTAIQWPSSPGEYFDTSHSPLNPRNADTVFFYGTLPLFLTKYVSTVLDRTGYDEVHLVGRAVSALFDLASVLLLFFMARRLFDWRVGLAASLLLALAALNIQGSHYFAVDTFLTKGYLDRFLRRFSLPFL